MHNGIIENARRLRRMLEEHGHTFTSETDTEVLAHLIEVGVRRSLEDAVIEALHQVEGAYGIAVVSSRDPGQDRRGAARAARSWSGSVTASTSCASDASAILAHTREVVYLDDGDLAVLDRNGYRIIDLDATTLTRNVSKIDWDLAQIERGGYAHFMLKEIFEQPQTRRATRWRGRLLLDEATAKLGGTNLTDEDLLAIDNIIITACGTSWHSALIGEHMIEELARIPVEVEYASEFRYRNPIVNDRTLCIVISQSGETADTLAAMREAQRRGARTLGIVNVVGSTIAREADGRHLPARGA